MLLVGRAALVGHLGRAPLPGLEVQRGPDHVEEGEEDEAEILEELGATAEEELEEGFPDVVRPKNVRGILRAIRSHVTVRNGWERWVPKITRKALISYVSMTPKKKESGPKNPNTSGTSYVSSPMASLPKPGIRRGQECRAQWCSGRAM